MEFKQKHIKFLAQQYLEGSQLKKPRKIPLLYKRHTQHQWVRMSRESSTPPLFPDIHSARQKRKRASPEGRLTLVLNVDSPGPAAYSPPSVNCRETSAPSYTFGWKTPPREGGGRRAWQKSWFQSKHPFTKKADFARETNWPAPSSYGLPLGSRPPNRPRSPIITIGQKREFTLVNKSTINDPAPNHYSTDCAYFHILQRAPAIIINPTHLASRWPGQGGTPGPAAYNVEKGHTARLPSSPSFYIQGVRRPKKHETGPFSTL